MVNKYLFFETAHKKRMGVVISWSVLLGVLLVNAWFLIARGAAYLDSDMAANFLNAVHNNQEHTIMSTRWYYSTAVNILSDANVFQIVLLFFSSNWVLARALGVVLMQVILVVVMIWLMRIIGFDTRFAVLFSAFSVAPVSYWLLLMIGFGGYYIPLSINSLLAIIFILGYIKTDRKSARALYIIFMSVEAILMGVNGIKNAIFPYVPLVITAFTMYLLYVRINRKIIFDREQFEVRFLIGSIISGISFGVGFLINIVIISKIFVFENRDNMVWAPLDINAILSGISECLSLLGYQSDGHVNFFTSDGTLRSVFSLQGVANLFGILMIVGFVFSLIRLIKRLNVLNYMEKTIVILFICSLIVGCIVFKLTEGYDTSAVYWVPVYLIMLIIMAIEIKTEDYVFEVSPVVLCAVLTFSVLITSFSTIKLYEENPMHADPQLVNIASWLEDNGYTKGYGSFWQCNAVTLLTDGKVEMWDVYGLDNLELHRWLQPKSHEIPPEGDKIFALIGPNSEIDRDVFLQYMNTEPGIPEIVYKDEFGYIVVEYK